MTAHNPITAAKAVAMVEAIGIDDARRLIVDHATAGLLRSYALSIETALLGGPRKPAVRGSTVPVELWRRIVREGGTDDVWNGGTVRLAADELIGGQPEVDVTGFMFDPKGIAALIDHLRGREQKPTAQATPRTSASDAPDKPIKSPPKRRPDAAVIPPGALVATVKETEAALGISHTTVYKLLGTGELKRAPSGTGTRITVASVREYAGLAD